HAVVPEGEDDPLAAPRRALPGLRVLDREAPRARERAEEERPERDRDPFEDPAGPLRRSPLPLSSLSLRERLGVRDGAHVTKPISAAETAPARGESERARETPAGSRAGRRRSPR